MKLNKNFNSFFTYVFIFATGSTGLIYQVVWQKYLSRILGNDIISTAIVISLFLGGLSLGYLVFGNISKKIKNPFKAYGLLELIIALWALLFPLFFKLVDYLTSSWSFEPLFPLLFQGIICCIILIAVPTIAMGGTLPFLTQGLVRNVKHATQTHARIYALNTIGAFFGTLLAGFFLVPYFGLPSTITSSAIINALAAIFFLKIKEYERPFSSLDSDKTTSSIFSHKLLYVLAFMSGIYVMMLENIFIRITNLSFGSSSYSFSIIVAVFIFAIGFGSYLVSNLKRISPTLLFWNQFFITLFLIFIYFTLDNFPYYAHLVRIIYQSNLPAFYLYNLSIFIFLLLFLLLPISFMGATIPLVFNELKRSVQDVGSSSGNAFSWNTCGNLVGSIIGGVVLFSYLDLAEIYSVAVILTAITCCLISLKFKIVHKSLSLACLFIVFTFMIVFPQWEKEHFKGEIFRLRNAKPYSFKGAKYFLSHFHKRTDLVYYSDGVASTVTVLKQKNPPKNKKPYLAIIVNGKSDSSTIGDEETLKSLAHLPALLTPIKKNVLVVGLGTGVTAGELTLYNDIEQIDVAEISPSVVNALPLFKDFTHSVHKNKKVKIHLGDAFRILARSNKKWDLIISEPSNPWVTGVDSLFSKKFYALANKHLNKNGMLVQWFHIYAANNDMIGTVLNTISQEFKYVRGFIVNKSDLIMLATNKKITKPVLDYAKKTLVENSRVKSSLDAISIKNIDSLLLREIWTPSFVKSKFWNYPLNTLDHPFLHYDAGKNFFLGAIASYSFILDPHRNRFYNEHLLTKLHPNWKNFTYDEKTLMSLLNSFRSPTTMASIVKKSLISKLLIAGKKSTALKNINPSHQFLNLYYFISQTNIKEPPLIKAKKTIKEKVIYLLSNFEKTRNWINPYPADGLLSLIDKGIKDNKDPKEKNWFIIQKLSLLFQVGKPRDTIISTISELKKDENGAILLFDNDKDLFKNIIERLSWFQMKKD